MSKPAPLKSKKNIFNALSITLLWSTLLYFSFTLKHDWAPGYFLQLLIEGVFKPSANIIQLKMVGGYYPYVFFYLILILSFFSFCLIEFINYLKNKKCSHVNFAQMCKVSIAVTLCLFIFVQTCAQTIYLIKHYHHFGLQPFESKYRDGLEKFRNLAEQYKIAAPGIHNAHFLTDLNIAKEPEMYIHRYFAYHLYPIDIRGIRKGDKKLIVMFYKRNTKNVLPENAKILFEYDDKNLIASQ